MGESVTHTISIFATESNPKPLSMSNDRGVNWTNTESGTKDFKTIVNPGYAVTWNFDINKDNIVNDISEIQNITPATFFKSSDSSNRNNYCSRMFFSKKKTYLTMGVFLFFFVNVFCQDKQLTDSLESVYILGTYIKQDKLMILEDLATNHSDPEKKLSFSEELIKEAQALDSTDHLFKGYLIKGQELIKKGDLSKALKVFFQAAEISSNSKMRLNRGIVNSVIADVYSLMGNHENAIEYYRKAIVILRKENDSSRIAIALYNTGDAYFIIKKYDLAITYFNESSLIFENIDHLMGKAFNLGSIGMIYAEQGKYDLAKKNINEAIIILEKNEVFDAISEFLISLSDIYAVQNNFPAAFKHAQKSLEIAQKYGFKKHLSDANLKLSELYSQTGNQTESFKYYKNHIIYRDSVKNIEAVQQMADIRTNYEISQKQTEVDLLDQQKKNQQLISLASGIGLLLIIVVAFGLYRRNNFINKAKLLVENEKERSDLLLLNILPEETAKELKDNGKVQAKRFDSVSVLFTDFEDFTSYSDKLSPEELVNSIDFYYSKFDEIMDKYGLEKIKTVGDAYMAAGGLPFPSDDHAIKLVKAAFEITDFVKEAKKIDPDNMTRFDIRIGINTGPVVAGVVGTKKFAYDIWGDTVNIASRMESNSEPGKINISENTYQLIKEVYDCTYRGEIEAKNKGKMKMYFVDANKVKTI